MSYIQIISDYFFENYEYFLRLFLSAILGFIIGLDREYKNKPAGIKTYMYVSISCTLLTIVSIVSVERFGLMNEAVRTDPLRLAAQIVSGLGFLGAGVILKTGLQVRGLTSAAMIFFVGGVGIGVGAGFYDLVIFSIIVSMILSRIGYSIEKRHKKKRSESLVGGDRKERFYDKEL